MSTIVEVTEVQDELAAILADVLLSVVGEEAVGTRDALPGGSLAIARLAIHDHVDDRFTLVEVRTAVDLAGMIAARMLLVGNPDPADIFDAFAELANIAGGNVKTLLCHHARLSLPSSEIVGPEHAPHAVPHPRAVQVRARVDGQVAQLSVVPDIEPYGLLWPPTDPDDLLGRRP